MQFISKFNKGFRFLLYFIDIFGKYAWVVPLKDKKYISIADAFQKRLGDSNRKWNKIWVNKGSDFYNIMTSVSKNVYIDKLDDLVGEYNNRYHRATKMKPVDVKSNTYIDFKKEVNDRDPKFKVGDHVRISNYKNVKDTHQTGLKKSLLLVKLKNDANGEEITRTLYQKELKKTNQQEFRKEKVI